MKVCHLTTVHNELDGRIFDKECVSLAKKGFDVYLIERGESFKRNGINVIGLGNVSSNRLRRILIDVKRIYSVAIKLNCDIYHIHDPELLLLVNAFKKRGKKVIFDSHENYREQIAVKSYLGVLAHFISRLYSWYENKIIKKVDGVIFPCTIEGKNPFDGKTKNAVIIGNQPITSDLPVVSEYNERDRVACYIGALRPDRGILQITQACNNTNTPLVLAGWPSSNQFMDELYEIDKNNIIKYLGLLDRDGVSKLLNNSYIGLVSELNIGQNNKLDTLPTKAFEYMAYGIPVVISKSKYVDSLLKKYNFGISVNPENVGEVSDAIQYIFDNPEEARRMGENGRRAVREKFNWDIEKKKLIDLYKELI